MSELHPAAKELVDALVARDDARPRTRQLGPGFSSLGGCARRCYHEVRRDPKCNLNTRRLPSIIGTIVHESIAELPLPGLIEKSLRLEEIDLPGAADRIHDGVLTDWKTTKLKTLEWVREHGPSRQYLWQVMAYAYAYNESQPIEQREPEGPFIRRGIHAVRLVFIPKDGDEEDIYVWEAPFDTEPAEEAIEWYAAIVRATQDDWPPKPEKEKGFCAKYCGFYGQLCPGLSKDDVDMGEDQDDPWAASAAAQYAKALELEKEAARLKRQAAEVLGGATGRFGGFTVRWVHRASTEVADADEMKRILAEVGREIPMKKRAGASYPQVRPVKPDGN